MFVGWLTGLAAALSQAAVPTPAPASEPAITNPDWLRKPTGEDIYAVYPGEAMRRGRSGRATISCTVTEAGRLSQCQVASEDPPGEGFGFAAQALSAQFLMKPMTVDGRPVGGGTVRIPINFRSPERHETTRAAPSSSDQRTLVRGLLWQGAPTYAQVAGAYPKAARERRAAGTATLHCRLDGEGGLDNCRAILEKPGGMGFGAAARGLVGHFRSPTHADDGRSLRGTYTQVVFSFTPGMLDPGEAVIGKPQWAILPDAALVARVYPASGKGLSGKAVLNCRVALLGRLEDCRTVSEAPADKGFAEAARQLTSHMLVSIWTDEGLPTQGGRVNVPLRFEPDLAAEKGG